MFKGFIDEKRDIATGIAGGNGRRHFLKLAGLGTLA